MVKNFLNLSIRAWISLVLVIFIPVVVHSQTNKDIGSWNIINLKAKISDRFTLFTEAQTRSSMFYSKFFYYEVKAGGSLMIDKHFNILVGTGNYNTFQESGNFKKPIAAKEWRIWEEIGMKQEVERLFFEHRYRIEQRFVTGKYRTRMRYRLSLLVPLNHKVFDPGTIYLAFAEEVFFTNHEPFFERNRLYGGLGYKMKLLTLQGGWMNQFDYKLTGTRNKNYFQLALLFDLDLSKSQHRTVPFQAD